MKSSKIIFLIIIFASLLILSCNGDDNDGDRVNSEVQSGFFSSKITTTRVSSGDQTEYTFIYNDQNQLSSIVEIGGLLDLSFEYGNQGLINLISINNLNSQITLEYEGEVVVRAIDVESGAEFPITYSANSYTDTNGNLIRLDDKNRIIEYAEERSSIDLNYNDNKGTFASISFQPALYLLGEDFLIATHFMAKSEISQAIFTTSTLEGDKSITYSVNVERDANDLITRATLNNEITGNPFLEYTIEYQER